LIIAELKGESRMKKILLLAALAAGTWLAQAQTSEAVVCARGYYRAGCVGPYGGAAVRGPYGGYAARGPYGGAAVRVAASCAAPMAGQPFIAVGEAALNR
jgi:hypothetical protein